MYPYAIIFDLGLYEICIVLAVVAAMFVFRALGDKANLSAKLQNMVLLDIPFALFIGYPSAVVFQWFYNGIRDGEFADSIFAEGTGSTFYGGLIGGAAAFLLFYFICGSHKMKDKEHLRSFSKILDLAPACIAIGHAIGRVGCFFAGCCYGIRTNSPLGVYLETVPYKVLPTQLFETFFLLLLFAYLVLRFTSGKHYNLSVYLIGYGIWRFMIEFLRGDDRGETIVSFLSPSQLIAVLLCILGVALLFLQPKLYAAFPSEESVPEGAETEETPAKDDIPNEESNE